MDKSKQNKMASLMVRIKNKLYGNNNDYNISVVNALVLYAGTQAIARLKNSTPPGMQLFLDLANVLDAPGRCIFLNAVANQLRFPNNHTFYFSCVLLFLFRKVEEESVKEQITRVLLERLIVHRPHPWGLLITFIELIKNPNYDFWSHEFTHCATEIEKLFESVARSCMTTTNNAQATQPV